MLVAAFVTSAKLSYVRLVTTFGRSTIPVFILPLSLASPLWVGAMSTRVGCIHHWGRNDEFCVAVVPATKAACILAEVV